MENVITFVFVLGVLLAILLLADMSIINGIYRAADALKTVINRMENPTTELYRGIGPQTDKVLYITKDENGIIDLENGGYSDIYHLRLFCWDRNNTEKNGLLEGKINGEPQPLSIPVLSSGKTVEYNLLDVFDESEINSVVCAVITSDAVRLFEPLG